MPHVPVLLNEVLYWLNPKPGQNIVDTTIGGGGHADAILKLTAPNGKLLGIDWDKNTIMKLHKKFEREIQAKRLMLVCGNFADIKKFVQESNFTNISGIFADLGMSSETIENSGRGFSFQKDEPLLMTYSVNPNERSLTAKNVVNELSEDKLVEIFKKFGDERYAKRYANAIAVARKAESIKTSRQLADIIVNAAPRRKGRIHPATKVFQAIRIVVNDEINNLSRLLAEGFEVLDREGKIVIISYHSIEDRIIKQTFRTMQDEGKAKILTKKPVLPSRAEIAQNRRARSAKLRALKKL